MISTTFNGCKIKVRAGKGKTWGRMSATLNGQDFYTVEKFDEAKAVAEIERMVTFVNAEPVDGNRWSANYYAPGTYELCDAGLHPREIGGQCTHATCQPGYWATKSPALYYGPGNPQCPAVDAAGLDCAGPAGHPDGSDHANTNGTWSTAVDYSDEAVYGDREQTCGHCGRVQDGYAAVGNVPLCHPDTGMDCFKLVTLYGHGAPCGMCKPDTRPSDQAGGA